MKWKHTRDRLASNKFCGAIVDKRTVFCVCGQKITLDNDYDESRLNEHSNNSRCKINNKKRQLGLPGLFQVLPNPKKKKENSLSPPSSPPPQSLFPDKPCPGLHSEQISSYINRTPSIYGGARRREVIGKEMFQDKFSNEMKFNSKKLKEEEMIQFNHQIISESEWYIDRFGMCIRSVNCERKTYGQICSPCSFLYNNPCFLNRIKAVAPDPKNIKYTPKFYYNNNPLLSYLKNNHIKHLHNILCDEKSSSKEFWAEFADKATQGAFEQKPVFKGLCYIMLQAKEREEQDKGLQNLKYSNEFLSFLVILGSISLKALDLFCQNLAGINVRTIRRQRSTSDDIINNPDLCYENVARFKRLLDTLHYEGPVVAMTDCTKVKAGLQYSSSLGCIVGSTLNHNDCKIKTYDDIYNKVSNIKQENAIAKYVRVYVLQVPLPKFPPVIVALIPTGSDDSEKIFALHQKLIEIAANLELHIISIGSDGAAAEFQAQNLLQATKTKYRVQHRNLQFGINFNCPIFPKIGPIIRIQDPKHGKKTARNAAMSGARLLTFGNSTVRFDHLLGLSLKEDSVMYKRDVIKLDRQDDNAAYRVFCSRNLAQVLDKEAALSPELRGLFIYLFTMGELIDSYLNRSITHHERVEMAMTAYFFLHLWKYHIETLSTSYSSYVSISKNFLAMQTFNIMISLVESLVLLIKIHRDYYEDIPLLPWKHGTESCEHIFGVARQFRPDFTYIEILQMVPKISQYFRSIQSDHLLFRKEKKVCEGYDFNECEEIHLFDDSLERLRYWPSDIEIDEAINIGYKRAIHLARYLEMASIPDDAHYFTIHKKFPTSQLEDFWNDDLNLETADHNEDNMDSLSISHCINNAVSEMNRSQELISDPRPELSLEKIYGACQIIIERIQKLPDIPWFPNDSRSDFILDNNSLNIKFLLDLRQCHDAYSERNLERIKFFSKNNNERNVLNEFNINKASSLVSHLTKNDCILTKSRENRWGSGGKTSNNISEKNHSGHRLCNNISLFPLRIGSFVIAKFDNTFCVAQIIAMYERDNSFHSYIDTPVSDLKSLSYASLKIFFHINGAIFSTICDHQFYIFSHAEVSHIVYHLSSRDISIDEEVLILKGQAKEMFSVFKK